MTYDLIQDRLSQYPLPDKVFEENAIKEICQEIALAGLSRSGFFSLGAFLGGTSLRILHGLNRFSEDLDFTLQNEDLGFSWKPYLRAIEEEFEAFGLSCSALDRSRASQAVKRAFLKEDSFGQVLQLQYPRNRGDIKKVSVKLEIDTQPPEGAQYETMTLDYPYPFVVVAHDLPSLFARKCAAILSRKYLKGRDWYDFLWYVRRRTPPNLNLLSRSLEQYGPYAGQSIPASVNWLVNELSEKVLQLDWTEAARDVAPFLSERDRNSLELWTSAFFLSQVAKMKNFLEGG